MKTMRDESFKDFVLDQLEALPDIEARGMFGGFGLYADKTFFGIISDGVLYLKTNADTKARYLDHGMKPFAPSEKQVLKNYFEVPAHILEDRESLVEWAIESIRISHATKRN